MAHSSETSWCPLLIIAAILCTCQVTSPLVMVGAAAQPVASASAIGPPQPGGQLLLASASPMALQHQQQQQQQQQHYNPNNHFQAITATAAGTSSSSFSSNPYTTATNLLLLDLRQQMITKALKFDETFRSLLSQSKLSLHNTFADTYGMMYERNTEIFTSLYESLEQYYATGQVKLTKTMENFFEHLYQKIFQVYNTNRAFPPSYLECATQQLVHLKPFKDAPDELTEGIKHAFVAARTFNQVLNSGIDVIKGIISLGQPTQCLNLINEKLLKRDSSNGARLAPCPSFCEQVMIRCVGRTNLEQLSEKWKLYAISMGELAKKLSVHYNIETIIAPLDVQISEAIMNFQENAQNITNQVGQACGPLVGGERGTDPLMGSSRHMKPIANRLGKRAAPATTFNDPAQVSSIQSNSTPNRRQQQQLAPLHYRQFGSNEFVPATYNHNHQLTSHNGQQAGATANVARPIQTQSGQARFNPATGNQRRPTPAESSQAGELHLPMMHSPASSQPIARRSPVVIDEIKDFMISTRSFWSNLPSAVCASNQTLGQTTAHSPYASISSAPSPMSSRRQQQTAATVSASAGGQCFREEFSLSDMNTDLRFRTEIQQLVNRLDLMISRIQSALSGNEIDWAVSSSAEQQQPPASRVQPATGGLGRPSTFGDNLGQPNKGSMVPQPTSTTTTTTTTAAPYSDLFTDDTDNAEDPDLSEDGSTPSIDDNTDEPENDDIDILTTSAEDMDEDATTSGSSANEQDGGGGAEDGTGKGNTEDPQGGNDVTAIDSLAGGKPNINLELDSNVLISPPDQSPQRSASSPAKLVITNPSQFLLVLLLSVALSIVNYSTGTRGGQIIL